MNKLNLLLITIIAASSLSVISGACVNASGDWSNCTGLLPGVGSNGSGLNVLYNSILDNFPNTTINATTGQPNQNHVGYFLMLVGIWISEVIFIEIGAHIGGSRPNELVVMNYATVMMLATALVFTMYGLTGGFAVDVATSICGVSIVSSVFFNRKGG